MAVLLLIEDDARVREPLVRALVARGHDVRAVATGAAGLAAVEERLPDLVVLDLGLPDIGGAALLRMLRTVHRVPVVVATAHDDETEIVRLLDSGADDYLVKPFAAEQLEARIRAVLRRGGGDALEPIVVGGLRVDANAREATLDGRRLDLTRKEFDLLVSLAERAGRVVTRRELLAQVWDQPYGGPEKTIDVHVAWLRRKLGEGGAKDGYIRTVRGVGLKLVDPRG